MAQNGEKPKTKNKNLAPPYRSRIQILCSHHWPITKQKQHSFLVDFIVPDHTLSPCPLTELIWVVQDAPHPDETLPIPLAFVI